MCHSPLHPFLATLPKCEHHVHLEGTLEPSLMFKLATRNNIPLPSDDAAFTSPTFLLERYQKFTGLEDFLHYYFLGVKVLVGQQDFEELAMEYFHRASRDGVKHAEVFFDPEVHAANGIPYATVVAGFKAGCERAEQVYGISTKLIVCLVRHYPRESAMATFDTVMASGNFEDGTLAGLGISSTEKGKPLKDYQDIFLKAKERGIRTTAHAGQQEGPSYVADALDMLKVQRIDHGRRLAEDPKLMERIAKQGIMLTLCPISNLRLRGVERIADLPVRKFLDAGVRFSINSDDPAYFGGYILDNYCAVQEAFDLSKADWGKIARNSINGSWCDEERKVNLLQQLDLVIEHAA